jgi:ABC-type antimicrobial peptide transport system permease subunit
VGEELAAMPEVAEASGMLQGWSQTEGEPFFFVFGYPTDSFILQRFRLKAGVSLDSRELHSLRGRPVLLGSAAAEVLDKTVGDSLRLSGSIFRVVGIFETGQAFEDSGAVMELSDAQALVGKSRQVNLFYIRLKDPDLQERFRARVERQYKELSLSGAQDYANRQSMVQALNAYVWVIGGLAIVLGGIGMMNAQLMAVFERTREIGVLRAVGWSRWRVLNLILGESLLVCTSGGVLGVGMGWALLNLLSTQTVMMGLMSTELSAGLLLQAALVVLVLGLLGGLYPAWRAAQLAPVEALRYEGGSSGQRARRLPVGGMAVQSLWQRSMRTLLTLSVIGLTVGSLMLLEGVIVGMEASMNTMVEGAEVMLRQADIADTSLSSIEERFGDRLAALPGVQSADGIIFTAIAMPDAGSFFIVFGYQPNSYAIRRFDMVEGETLSGNRQVILGRMMADALDKKIGSTIDLSGSRFKVIGIYESKVSWEEMGGVITLRDAQLLAGRPRVVTMYALTLKDPDQAKAMVARLNADYPEVQASLSTEFAEQMPDFERSGQMLNGISALAVLVGGVGVLNTMLMAVFERTREIGVLRSMGWRRRGVLSMILQEALLLGLIGGVSGIGIAIAMTAGLRTIPVWGTIVEPAWEWQVMLRAMLTALILGLVGGLYPAYRATRLQPVEALRYE